MERRVYEIVDEGKANKVLSLDDVKKTGYIVREIEGKKYVILSATEDVFSLLEENGLKRAENEEDILKKIEEEEEKANAGVGFLGF